MFQLLPCSVCQRTYSLRKDVHEDALLKCPNCGNQFRLGDVLDAFYAPWIIQSEAASPTVSDGLVLATSPSAPLSEPTDTRLSFDNLLNTHVDVNQDNPNRLNAITDDPGELAADNVFDAGNLDVSQTSTNADGNGLALLDADAQLSDGQALDDVLDLDEPLQPENEPLTIGSNQYESPLENAAAAATTGVKKAKLRRSDRGGGVWSVLQVVLGGAAAIPVTLLLLWWVVGKDVMNAGPTVAQYVPWVVPVKFRSPVENLGLRPNGPRVPPPALGEGGFRNFDEELKGSEQTPQSTDSSMTDSAENADRPSSPVESTQASSNPSASTPANEAPAPAQDDSASNAMQLVKKIQKMIKEWDQKSASKSKEAVVIFTELVSLTEQLAAMPGERGITKLLQHEISTIGIALRTNYDLRTSINVVINSQFSNKESITKARVFLGLASEVKETESGWTITKTHLEGTPPIEVAKSVVTNIQSGQGIFCLGQVDSADSPIKAVYLQILP